MLAHSPPFPIIIDHFHTDRDDRMTGDDVEGIILALKHRDRVRRIRFRTSELMREHKGIIIIDGEFPMLEYMCIAPMHDLNILFPKTFQAPQLRHLLLADFTYPIGSPLLSAAMGLVGLALVNMLPFTYVQPHELLHRVSLMPQLEVLWIGFDYRYPRNHADPDVTHMHNGTHISLPNLRFFQFQGFSAYLEALLSRITAPHLEVVQVALWEQRTYSVPYLLQFMSTSEDLRLGNAILSFDGRGARLSVYPNETARLSVFDMHVQCRHGDVVQILNALSPLFSSVVYLTLDYKDNRLVKAKTRPTDWRILLRSFNNVKILFVGNGVIGKLARSLQLDDGESPNDLLPELKELTYSPTNDNADAFTGFIDARQDAGRRVTLVHLQNAASHPSGIVITIQTARQGSEISLLSSSRIFQPVRSIR